MNERVYCVVFSQEWSEIRVFPFPFPFLASHPWPCLCCEINYLMMMWMCSHQITRSIITSSPVRSGSGVCFLLWYLHLYMLHTLQSYRHHTIIILMPRYQMTPIVVWCYSNQWYVGVSIFHIPYDIQCIYELGTLNKT